MLGYTYTKKDSGNEVSTNSFWMQSLSGGRCRASSDSDDSGCLENRRPPSDFQVTEIRINRLQMETCKHQERSNVTVTLGVELLYQIWFLES